ncbi:MAG: hypothetical protein HY302_07865 [Opitutae bacterium]|nr:hypothetical protein [Opitutae bacterium]
MYNLTLVNLSADARTAAANDGGAVELKGISGEELQTLLDNFCGLDAVQNVTTDPEIRIQSRHESYLVRTGQKKLFLYDVLNREAPAQVLTPAQVIAELDGSAMASRTSAPFPFARAVADETASVVSAPPRDVVNLARVAVMLVFIAALLGGVRLVRPTDETDTAAGQLVPPDPTEQRRLQLALAGVFMTGAQPGQHGIVLTSTGGLKLFEVNSRTAPGVVHAKGRLGRIGPKLALATDQPGGIIRIADNDTLVYCGETYRRIP